MITLDNGLFGDDDKTNLLAVLASHEAQRDGVVTDDNEAETLRAVASHTAMAFKLASKYGTNWMTSGLVGDMMAALSGKAGFEQYVGDNYSSEGDYFFPDVSDGGDFQNGGDYWNTLLGNALSKDEANKMTALSKYPSSFFRYSLYFSQLFLVLLDVYKAAKYSQFDFLRCLFCFCTSLVIVIQAIIIVIIIFRALLSNLTL